MALSLFDQMSVDTQDALASLEGFHVDTDGSASAGFRLVLRDIHALPEGFTVGDAYRAFLSFQYGRSCECALRSGGGMMTIPVGLAK